MHMSSFYHQKKSLPADQKQEAVVARKTEKAAFKKIVSLKHQASGLGGSLQELPFSNTREVSVAVDEMPLPDFIHYIFSDIFGVNYIIDKKVKKSKELITLNLNQKINEARLFEIVTDLLKQYKFSIYGRKDLYYICQSSKNRNIAIGVGASLNDIPAVMGEIRQIIPVKYIDTMNLLEFLPKSSGIKIVPAINENLFVATGAREQIKQIVNVVNLLDKPAMRGRFAGMLRLKYWSPSDMALKLKELLIQEGLPVTDRPGRNGIYINKLERWETILFFAAEKEWLERVRYWVKILDVPLDKDENQYFLYFPENSKASELGESLVKILGISESGGAAESFETVKEKENKTDSNKKDITMITGDIRVATDQNRNALIIYTTLEKYKKLESLLKQLDIMPVQVLIEATVAEVTLTDTLKYGLEWFLKNDSQDQTSILRTMKGLGLGSGGLDYSFITDSGKFMLFLNALAQEDMIKILSSPRITVRDGKSASIIVGTEVPVITSEATSPDIVADGTSGIIRSVQYRSTGISLQVTPTVHSKGIVTLEITQEVSEAQANDVSDISSPIILNRTVSTEIASADGQTILIGGLIKENNSETVTKVPFFGNIPIFGYLFKTTSKGFDRTELVIMLTPHIIRNTEQIDEMKEAIFESFEHIEVD